MDLNFKGLEIYHFILDHRIGGPHIYVNTIRSFLNAEYRSTLFTTKRGPVTDRAMLNFRHFLSLLYPIEILINSLYLIINGIREKIVTKNLIYHVHGAANVAPLIAARILGVPVLWTIHETNLRYRILFKIGLSILQGTRHEVAFVAKRSAVVYVFNNAFFLPASVDESFWSYKKVSDAEINDCEWLSLTQFQESTIRILTVGNLNPLKGADLLLDALSIIDGGFNLKIVGSELVTHQAYRKTLTEKALIFERACSGRRVDFLGWQSSEKVRALLASCDIFVIPSLSEACPIALLEAMAMGCHIVAADVGDVSAMLAGCSKSYIFKAGCVSDLVMAIDYIRSSVLLEKTGGKKSCIGPEWQLSRVAEETAMVYRRLLSESS